MPNNQFDKNKFPESSDQVRSGDTSSEENQNGEGQFEGTLGQLFNEITSFTKVDIAGSLNPNQTAGNLSSRNSRIAVEYR